MKQQKWSGVKIDRKRLKEHQRMKRAELLTEVFLFGVFVLGMLAIVAFILETVK